MRALSRPRQHGTVYSSPRAGMDPTQPNTAPERSPDDVPSSNGRTPNAGRAAAPKGTHPPSPTSARRSPEVASTSVSPTLERRTLVRSSKGHTYLRVQLPYEESFQGREQGVLHATEQVLAPRSPAGKAY